MAAEYVLCTDLLLLDSGIEKWNSLGLSAGVSFGLVGVY